jgi:predicted ribosomally synthesized peptide with nif11-like leader
MEFTKEQIEKAIACKSSDELLALAESEGISLTKEEAEKYFQQLSDKSISEEDLENIAGGCIGNACAGNISAVC